MTAIDKEIVIIKIFIDTIQDRTVLTELANKLVEYFPGCKLVDWPEQANIRIMYYDGIYNINGFRRQSIEETIEYLRLLAPRYLQEFVED